MTSQKLKRGLQGQHVAVPLGLWLEVMADDPQLEFPTSLPYNYPLVMTNIAIEHGHRNSEFSH